MRLLAKCAGVLLLLATSLTAQTAAPVTGVSSVLIIDSEELFLRTLFGRKLLDELDAEAASLQSENDRIVAELLAEESALTQQRPDMDVAAFQAAAEAFDLKAQEFRRERDAAAEQFGGQRGIARNRFLERVYPIIGRLMLERGAAVVLDRSRRSVFLAVGSVDITNDAITLIDETLGDGTQNLTVPDIPLIEVPEPELEPELEPARDLAPQADPETEPGADAVPVPQADSSDE